MSVLLGHSRYLMGKCIGFMGFLDLCCQYKNWNGIFLALDIKLELGPSVSTLGGYAVWNLGGGIGTSGWIMLRHEGDMWTLCWKLVESFPSSYYITLDCTEGRGLVLSGCTFWGAMADFFTVCFCGGSALFFTLSDTLENIWEICSIATIWESPMLENGAWGDGFFKELANSCAAMMTFSEEE